MHDFIHAAIAAERVRNAVDTGETRRTARRAKRERLLVTAAPQRELEPARQEHRGRIGAMLRLRPWVM